MKIKEWIIEKSSCHYFLYFFATFLFYVVNFFKVNGTGGQWAFANELIFVALFVLIIPRYGWRTFLKPIYYVWCAGAFVAFPFIFRIYRLGTDYDLQLIARYVNVILCGLILIRVLFYYSNENFRFYFTPHMVVWILLLFFCILSRNSSTWQISALVLYGTFYFAPLSDSERRSFISGVVDAIIVCFFIYQGHALLFCPYDFVRYRSFFSNSDCSAKFFTISYIGFLIKYCMLQKGNCKIHRLWCGFFAISMWAFLLFTMTRSGFIGMGMATFGFILYYIRVYKQSFGQVLQKSLLCIGVFILCVPVVYCGIRYIPALRHHPIYIGGYTEERVHSWDPVDSEKYVSVKEICDVLLNRVNISNSQETPVDNSDSADVAKIKMLSADEERVFEYYDGVKPGADSRHPIYIKISFDSPIRKILGIRRYIYQTFWEEAGWFGNEEEYPTFWVMTDWVYPSAHNSFLDFTVKYGYIAGMLYGLLQLLVIVEGIRFLKNSPRDEGALLMLLCALSYFGWGLFYSVSITGEINDTLFWLTLGLCEGRNANDNIAVVMKESIV